MKAALRNVLRVGLGTGIAGATLGLAAAPAFAAASLTVSPSGTVTGNGTVTATGTDGGNSTAFGQSRTLTLDLSTPDGQSKQWSSGSVASTRSATVTGSFDTAGGINGDYTFTLKVNGSTSDTQTVTVQVPPAPIGGFSASPSGSVAHFSWSANGEPDLAGYDISDVTGGGRRDLTPGGLGTNVCSGGACSVDIDFGSSARGTTRSFVIDALRYTSPSHSGTVASADSPSATVDFPAPPTPAPSTASSGSTAGSSGGAGGSGGSSSSGSGGSTAGSGTGTGHGSSGGAPGTSAGAGSGDLPGRGGPGRSLSSSHAGAALRAYLPTLSAGAAPALPSVVTEVKPLPQGTFKPTLAYPDQVVGETVRKNTGTPVASVRNDIVRVLNVEGLWKSLAGAALILLVAAHLRAWVASVDTSQD